MLFFFFQAAHAEKCQVDALLCLPELFNKPKTATELIDYLKLVSKAAPNTPLLYYHLPMWTNVTSQYLPTHCHKSLEF